MSKTTHRTGLDPCPFKTSGSRVTNSSTPVHPSSSCSSEWTRPRLDVAPEDAEADETRPQQPPQLPRTIGRTHGRSRLTNRLPPCIPAAIWRHENTSIHVTSSPFKARTRPNATGGIVSVSNFDARTQTSQIKSNYLRGGVG